MTFRLRTLSFTSSTGPSFRLWTFCITSSTGLSFSLSCYRLDINRTQGYRNANLQCRIILRSPEESGKQEIVGSSCSRLPANPLPFTKYS